MKRKLISFILIFGFTSPSDAHNFFQCFGHEVMIEISIPKDPQKPLVFAIVKDGKSTSLTAKKLWTPLATYIEIVSKDAFSCTGSMFIYEQMKQFSTSVTINGETREFECNGQTLLSL